MPERTTTLRPQLLAPGVIAGFERRAIASDFPTSKLPEIIELRAIVRELISHIGAQDVELERLQAMIDSDFPAVSA